MTEDYALIDFTNDSKLTLRLSILAENGHEYFVTDVKPEDTTMQISPTYTTWNARLMWDIDVKNPPPSIQSLISEQSLTPVEKDDEDAIQLPTSFTVWATTGTAFAPVMTYKPDPDTGQPPRGDVAHLTLTMDWSIPIRRGRYRFSISEAGVDLISVQGGFVMPPFNI